MRLIDADKIRYSWQIDADGTEHDGVTLESVVDKIPTEEAIPLSVIEDIKAEIIKTVCEESNQCDGDYAFLKWCAGLRYSLNIIDNHIAERSDK